MKHRTPTSHSQTSHSQTATDRQQRVWVPFEGIMPSTPRRKVSSEQTHSPAQSLIGCSVAIPANIFKESNSHFTGKVVGTPRRKNAVYVKVDQDNTEYWFPTDEVAKWVVKDDKAAATLATPKTPKRARRALHQDIANDASTAASSQPTARAKRTKKQAATEGDQHKTPALLDSQPQHVHDAASCHPERPEDLTETIEGLAATSAQEIQAVTASTRGLKWSYLVAAMIVLLLALSAFKLVAKGLLT